MTITALKPIIIKPERVQTPQCCVKVDPPTSATMWRRERYEKMRPQFDPDYCQHESVIEIDGKHYCKVHAGKLALEKWLAGELVENREPLPKDTTRFKKFAEDE